MNKTLSNIIPSWILLVVMLLNPIVGLAGTVLFDAIDQDVQMLEPIGGMPENCHDDSSASSGSLESQQHAECCEETCMCAQAGCHSPIATLGNSVTSVGSGASLFYAGSTSYISPSLSTHNPPPIS